MELKEKTKLSSRTLDKHLDKMMNLQIIEKKKDIENGKYPYPVYFKATHELTTYIKASMIREKTINQLEPLLNQTKDPIILLEAIHAFNQAYFIKILNQMQQNKNIEELYFFAECFLWAHYKQYTSKLIQASHKIINNININQSLIKQAKRQIRVYGQALKEYEKMEKQNQP